MDVLICLVWSSPVLAVTAWAMWNGRVNWGLS